MEACILGYFGALLYWIDGPHATGFLCNHSKLHTVSKKVIGFSNQSRIVDVFKAYTRDILFHSFIRAASAQVTAYRNFQPNKVKSGEIDDHRRC